jgi:Kef-type K+ transport system membrane component KefB
MKVILLLVLAGLANAARSFSAAELAPAHGSAMAFGYVLLSAFLAGQLFRDLRLPRLTGYLVMGFVAGPAGLGLLTASMVDSLGLVNGAAVFLIALTAGLHLDLRSMRPLLRSVAWISLIAVMGTALLLAGVYALLSGQLAFMDGMPLAHVAALSLVLGTVTVAQSPAVVVALRDETAADGPMIRTVLGVVVLADLLVIVLFAATSAVAKGVFGAEGTLRSTVGTLGWEVLGSLGAGALMGGLLAIYLRKVRSGAPLFVLTMAVVVAEVGSRLDLDPLLVALMAGVLVRNVTSTHAALGHAIDASTLPVYAVFFAVAGARIHLDVLTAMTVPLLVLVATRALGLVAGTRLACRLAGAPPGVRSHAGWGLVPQAGLALALAVLFADLFPEFGQEAASLTLGIVAVNELGGPVLFRLALVRSGEAGRGASATAAAAFSSQGDPTESQALSLDAGPRRGEETAS